MSSHKYVRCHSSAIPDGVRFDLTRRTAGCIVREYFGGFGASEHGDGDPFLMFEDQSISGVGRITHYRLKRKAPVYLLSVPFADGKLRPYYPHCQFEASSDEEAIKKAMTIIVRALGNYPERIGLWRAEDCGIDMIQSEDAVKVCDLVQKDDSMDDILVVEANA